MSELRITSPALIPTTEAEREMWIAGWRAFGVQVRDSLEGLKACPSGQLPNAIDAVNAYVQSMVPPMFPADKQP